MLKKMWSGIKCIVLSGFILYGYNMIASPLNLIVPINLITLSAVTVAGIPALLSLIVIKKIIF